MARTIQVGGYDRVSSLISFPFDLHALLVAALEALEVVRVLVALAWDTYRVRAAVCITALLAFIVVAHLAAVLVGDDSALDGDSFLHVLVVIGLRLRISIAIGSWSRRCLDVTER